MQITKEQIKTLNPCSNAWQWYLKSKQDTNLLKLLLNANEQNYTWASWLFTKLMTKKQNQEIAIFAAEQVIHIYENKYPNDDRPRKADRKSVV